MSTSVNPTGPGTVTEKFFATTLPPKKQQKHLPKIGGDPTSLFKLGSSVLLMSGGVLARKLTK